MEVIKEGTHTCLQYYLAHKENNIEDTIEGKIWQYYLSVEYEVLKHNTLKTLIPVQLREKDGEKSLLFDITGMQPLRKREKETGFSQKECEKIMHSIINLLEEIDNYMLNLECLQFRPEYIYTGTDGELRWLYYPQLISQESENLNMQDDKLKTGDFQKKIEDFFAWILTQIDYEDAEAVQYMYRFYNKIRKLGFSKELLERYVLSETPKEVKNISAEPYEEFFKEDLEQEKVRKFKQEELKKDEKVVDSYSYENFPDITRSKKEDRKNQQKMIYTGVTVVFTILVGISGALEGYLIFSGMKSGFTKVLFQYCIGGGMFVLTFLFGIVWSIVKIRKIRQNQNQQKNLRIDLHAERAYEGRERNNTGNNIQSNIESNIGNDTGNNTGRMIETNVDWESEGEGTTILSGSGMIDRSYPILREEDTGIVYLIKESPFYIGSAAGNQLEIQDRTVSREHAVILEDIYVGGGEGYIIRDMNSTNGTWLDDKKMRKGGQEKLKDGMIIRFAKKEYKFLLQNI